MHGAARADVAGTRPGGPGADAAPGPAGRRGRGRPPDLPARRRAGAGQDGAGAARRGGGERLPAAGRRAERRQDELGARGRPVDTSPLGHRDPRQRRRDRRLRRHRDRQLRGARPPRGVAGRLRLARHGRRRGALHQEQDLPALAARPGALRADPVLHRASAADGPHRHPADQRHRGLPGHLAVPRLDRREEAARRADARARRDRPDTRRSGVLRRRPQMCHRPGHRPSPQGRRGRRYPRASHRRPPRRAGWAGRPVDPSGRA